MISFFKSKKGMWTMGIILTLVVLYFIFKQDIDAYYKRMMGKVEDDPTGGNVNIDKILSKGDKGLEVKALQQSIVASGVPLPKYGDDGIFGMETESALVEIAGVKKISLSGFQALVSTKKNPAQIAEGAYN